MLQNYPILNWYVKDICMSLDDPGLLSEGDRMTWHKILDTYIFPTKPLNESLTLPNAQKVYHYNSSSDAVTTALFYSNLCRTSNCRASLDKWDCENCVSTLPDGALDALYDIREIVYHAVSDQLLLHPNYKVDIVGHSFGGAIGSLLTVDLFQRLPFYYASNISGKPRVGDKKYAGFVAKNKISIRRYNEENDDVAHQPLLEEGYMHEGDEYWLKSKDKLDLRK
ncbi:hypothetical protein HPULCUR_000647 [Helicostylum pulchrum]|uniref:Fungal lipase-type domain-containing protein n=1 Tax=Helicostylum pulchrum TaxID=562976 RepID=A0ABP9XML3_9FUNG